MRTPRLIAAAALAALPIAAAGCGGSNLKDVEAGTPTTVKSPPPPKAPKTNPNAQPPGPISTNLKTKPAIPKAAGDPPPKLISKDIVAGTGAAAKAGQQLTVRYVGVTWSADKQFDASWDRKPNTFPFTLGQGAVIKGWDQGLTGMKVGGRRELVIPPSLAYGTTGSPPTIGANETLVFVIDLLKVSKAAG